MLGEKLESVEKAFHLAKGNIAEDPIYYDVSKLNYGNLEFKLGVFFRDEECKSFAFYASQSRILDSQERFTHGQKADIDKVFHDLASDLASRYGPAPSVAFGPDSSNFGMEAPCQAYTWVNGKYALMLMLSDSVTTHSLKLVQYKVGETQGEFTGEEQLKYLANLYASRAGKLPANWPVARGEAPPPGTTGTPDGHSTRESTD